MTKFVLSDYHEGMENARLTSRILLPRPGTSTRSDFLLALFSLLQIQKITSHTAKSQISSSCSFEAHLRDLLNEAAYE